MAAESPFSGERANALAAATRLAEKHGLSLEDAAAGQTKAPERQETGSGNWWRDPGLASFVHLQDRQIQLDKARRDRALEEAYARGLDADLRKAGARAELKAPRSGRRRAPMSHARVLLSETSLPLGEISSITGLDLHKIVELRLKMRGAA